MNRIVIFEEEKIEDQLFSIKDPLRIKHIKTVIMAKKRDKLKLCLINKCLASGIIDNIKSNSIDISIIKQYSGINPWCHLIIGLSRPLTCKKIIQHGTALGVSSFNFFKATLSEKSYKDSKIFTEKNYLKVIYDGLSQSSKYYKNPKVQLINSINNYKTPINTQKFILTKNTNKMFNNYKIYFNRPILIAVGPERGWTYKEEEIFIKDNYSPVKLSSSTLRTEIATFISLGQLELLKKFN